MGIDVRQLPDPYDGRNVFNPDGFQIYSYRGDPTGRFVPLHDPLHDTFEYKFRKVVKWLFRLITG